VTESSVVLPPEAGSRKCQHIAFLPSAVITTFQACQKSLNALTTMRLSIDIHGRRRPIEVSNSVQIWEALGAKL
jgi:hypothetical protein